jgi:fumarylacetoacetate (FAA) hydrolase
MKLVTYNNQGNNSLGLIVNNKIYNLQSLDKSLPNDMLSFLQQGKEAMDKAKNAEASIKTGTAHGVAFDEQSVLSPITNPTSCRDAYAFRQHVSTARRNRGVDMIPEFDQFPIWYFTNHNAVQGPGVIDCMPDHFHKLDFELEVAIIVGKKGRNIKAAEADEYIAGYLIMNDMSARLLQMEEMKLNLGPAKGKDFSTAVGPYLVTTDEMEQYLKPTKPGHTGKQYDLTMTCKVNGVEVSRGNAGDMDWTFAEILERCAYGADIYPGDLIGSGTVGTGCFLELNGSALLADPNFKPQWLKDGDVVEMEITGLGKLVNNIKAVNSDHSLLALKKNMPEGGK